MTDDLEIQAGADFDVDAVDDMPQFVRYISGVYKCSLSLKRETEAKNDKEQDNLIFGFTIQEILEEKEDHGVKEGDMVYVRYSLLKSKRDNEEGRRESFGLRLAKPSLIAIKDSLQCGASLNEIIHEAQDVTCTATFSTRTSKGTNKNGEAIEYVNIDVKKLIVA